MFPATALIAPLGIFDLVREWITSNGSYIFFVLVAIIIDHLLGTVVHFFIKRDFSFKKNIVGIFVKLGLVFCVGVLFEGFNFIYTSENLITEWLSVITRIMVFLYPASSAFINSSIITKGKFPPVAWINRISNFNKNLNIHELTDNEKGNS
jgi:hypothetical protein